MEDGLTNFAFDSDDDNSDERIQLITYVQCVKQRLIQMKKGFPIWSCNVLVVAGSLD